MCTAGHDGHCLLMLEWPALGVLAVSAAKGESSVDQPQAEMRMLLTRENQR